MNCLSVALLSGLALPLATLAATPRPVSFEKRTLTSEYWCDGVNAADINGDGAVNGVDLAILLGQWGWTAQ